MRYVYHLYCIGRVERVVTVVTKSPSHHIPTHMYRARELFARGVLPERYTKPAETFTETPRPLEVDGVDKLPEGYVFSDWMRCACMNPLCLAVRQIGACVHSCMTIIHALPV